MDRGLSQPRGLLMTCIDCRTPLELGDGHDKCPSCLGVEHLRQGLTELACMNCACMSLATRSARLARLEGVFASQPLAAQREDARPARPPNAKGRRPTKLPLGASMVGLTPCLTK